MATVCIIHGAYGSPEENWFPWLRQKLEENSNQVILPRFPTPEGQTLANWLAVIQPHVKEFGDDTIMVGHSLGPVFISNVLNTYDVNIRAAIFASGFRSRLGNPDFDEINKTFVDEPLDLERVKHRCARFVAFISQNDPYVPLDVSQNFAESFNAEIISVPEAGHFNSAAGYTQFPALLDVCNDIIDAA